MADETPVVNVYIDGERVTETVDRRLNQRRLEGVTAGLNQGTGSGAAALAAVAVRETAEAGIVTTEMPDADVTVRSMALREIDARVVPWDVVIESPIGLESFSRGSFAGIDPKKVVLKLGHEGTPAGRGTAVQERDDGAYMTFKVSKTQSGDELLTLANDGVTPHVSVGYRQATTKGEEGRIGGRRVTRITKVDLDHVATTYRPAYQSASVIAIREESPVTETITTPPAPDPTDRIVAAFEAFAGRSTSHGEEFQQKMMDRLEAIEERSRKDIIIPGRTPEPKKAMLVDWAQLALRMLSNAPVSPKEIQERALEDIITPDNPGAVPDAFVNDLIGVIDEGRPFLSSTRQIVAPESGMSIVVPVLGQRSTAAVQATEKTEIESTALKVTNQTFDAVTIAGGADVSIQMIRRATRSYIDLLLSDLRSAYAATADARALATLFAAGTTPGAANIDPEALQIGEAWTNSIDAIGKPPDTIWLSAAGVASFINALNDGTNSPLYFNLQANFTVGGGPGGNVSALRPVYVPALTGTSVDVMIGPRDGFAWAEDGSFQLQADNPTLAGRDIAIVGILFFIPRYPAAFTTYDLGS